MKYQMLLLVTAAILLDQPGAATAQSRYTLELSMQRSISRGSRGSYVESDFKRAAAIIWPPSAPAQLWLFPVEGNPVQFGDQGTAEQLAVLIQAPHAKDELGPAAGSGLARLQEFERKASALIEAANRAGVRVSNASHACLAISDTAGHEQPWAAIVAYGRRDGRGWIALDAPNLVVRAHMGNVNDLNALTPALKGLPGDAEFVAVGPRGVAALCPSRDRLLLHLAGAWQALEPRLASLGGSDHRLEFSLSAWRRLADKAPNELNAKVGIETLMIRLVGGLPGENPRQDPMTWLLGK